MSNKPTLGVKSFTIDGFMNNNMPVEMRASAWINVPKDKKYDTATLQVAEQVKELMIQHGISVSVQLQHRNGDDPKMWPRIASFPLFPNRPDTQPQQQQNYQAPPTAPLDDSIPF